jgi:hypothetical protein
MQKFLIELDFVEQFQVKRTKLYKVKGTKESVQIGLFA